MPKNEKHRMALDPPPLAIARPAHPEPNEQETKETCRRLWGGLAGANERNQARMASGYKLVSPVDRETEDQTALIERRLAEMRLERDFAPDVDQAVEAGS